MKLVASKGQLIANIEAFEMYLVEGDENETAFMRDLIGRGRCFVAYQVEKELRFAPSRFLGYIGNNPKKHSKSRGQRIIDGRETNPVIGEVLDTKLLPSEELDKRYLTYCKEIGITPSNYKKRKYWILNLPEDFTENELLDGEFAEGKLVARIHKRRERNTKVIAIAKHNFKVKHKKLCCEVCEFDFEKEYGNLGKGFIEGHHIIPVSEMTEGHVTTPDEIALVCANCHRMIHNSSPWLSIEKLRSLMRKSKK